MRAQTQAAASLEFCCIAMTPTGWAVDHMRLPGVTKLPDGTYRSQNLGMDIDETTSMRAALIQSAVEQYDPDLLIVDKEPTGFRGELLPALEWIKSNLKTKLVLGLRDVLDEPDVLATEWARKGAVEATEAFYDELWVYGLKSIYDPTTGLPFSQSIRDKMHWTGYLRRTVLEEQEDQEKPYILITPGGGGDGEAMVNLVLEAYEQDKTLSPRAVLVYGPFLSGDTRDAFEKRVEALEGRVTAVGFESRIESLFVGAEGVICMGGYNTFCEVLSFDKKAVIVPRTVPRLEQYIRAKRGEELGLVHMIDEYRDGLTPQSMINADQKLPSQASISDGLLDGLPYLIERATALMDTDQRRAAE